MRNVHTEYKKNGFTINIAYDEWLDPPDRWDDGPAFLGEVKGYGNKNWSASRARSAIPFGEGPWDFDRTDYYELGAQVSSEEELREAWEEEYDPTHKVYPVKLEDYGSNGCRLRECSHDRADGYVIVKLPYTSEVERLAHVDFDPDALKEAVLKEWNMYFEGDVHIAYVLDSSGEIVESLGGLYGRDVANEWVEETLDFLKHDSRDVAVQVTHGSLPLPFPARVVSEIEMVKIPRWVGLEDVPRWAISEGPWAESHDVLAVNLWEPRGAQ